MTVTVHHGDSREVLKAIPDGSVDACVTDAPYALTSILKRFGATGAAEAKPGRSGVYKRQSAGFMGQRWDTGEAAHDPAFWAEVLRVLKPGAHLVAFSGTRTQHRQVCAIEDAGFEIRDTVLDIVASDTFAMRFMASLDEEQRRAFALVLEESSLGGLLAWCFGSGFPKSHNQEGGLGTALKPAFEPICLARKPLFGTVAGNLAAHGTGALNIDGCRIHGEDARGGEYVVKRLKPGATLDKSGGNWRPEEGGVEYRGNMKPGRWPANVVHDGSAEVTEAFPVDDRKASGPREIRKRASGADQEGNRSAALGAENRPSGSFAGLDRGDSGSPARFFYSAKADAEDRLGSKHPTVKPVDLMAYLCRLVTPPGGVVLDPFAGTGTTGLAAMRGGFDAILIEREARYVADIERRLAWARGEGRLTAQEKARGEARSVEDLPLFGGEAA